MNVINIQNFERATTLDHVAKLVTSHRLSNLQRSSVRIASKTVVMRSHPGKNRRRIQTDWVCKSIWGGYWCTFLEVVKSPEMCVLTLHQAMDLVIKKRTLHLHLMRYCCSLISTSPWSGNEGNFIANSNFLITKAFIQTHFICSFVLTKKNNCFGINACTFIFKFDTLSVAYSKQ